MANDFVTETTSQSWFGRIGSAIKGVLFGIVLFAVSFVVLFWNEGRAVTTAQSLSEGAKSVISVTADKREAQHEGKLVHLTGQATTNETLSDAQFGIAVNALKLQRQVQMYQWQEKKESRKEKKLGGSEETTTTYSYTLGWTDKAVDSSRFKVQEGHVNPPVSLADLSVSAQGVTVGDFQLSPGLLAQISNTETLPPPATQPAGLGREFHKTATGYYRGSDPEKPQLGDLRITFSVVRPQTVSVVAQQAGTGLRGYATAAGRTLEMLTAGTHAAAEMFATAQKENSIMTWILRLVGFIVMWLGLSLILNPFKILADVVPFVGSIVGVGIGLVTLLVALPLSLITIAIAWIFYRPLLGISLLVLAVAVIVLLVRRMKKQPVARTTSVPAAG